MFERPIGKIRIPHKLKNGNLGRSKHWSSAHKDRKEWMQALRNAEIVSIGSLGELEQSLRFLAEEGRKVGIVVTRVLGKGERLWDSDSVLRGSAKELIDSLVEDGYLVDDSPKYVAWSFGCQCDNRRDQGPFVTVAFYEDCL